ncbi:MAG: hypothetical protein JST92_10015 [Deltaproteobacteria bacterium]|nr:hypothetical protein [Deltaproteobacteria bacterium]
MTIDHEPTPEGQGASDVPPPEGEAAFASAPKAEATKDAAGKAESASDQDGTPEWLKDLLDRARRNGRARAAALKIQHPADTPLQLGKRLVGSLSMKAGLWGAATGTLALITLPIGLPASVALTLLLEAELLFALLALYGFNTAGEVGRMRLFALWAGGGFVQVAKNAGLKAGTDAVAKALAGTLPARLIGRINPILFRQLLKRLGLAWVPKALKLWPLIGAPIGFVLDRAALKALGAQAIEVLEHAERPVKKA